jgi:hypothetical protein
VSGRTPGEEKGALPGGPPGDLLSPLDDRPGPARALTPARRAAMVTAIVNAALADGSAPARPAPSAGRTWHRRLAFAAAILLCLSAAVAPALIRLARQADGPRAHAGSPQPPAPRGELAPGPTSPIVEPPRRAPAPAQPPRRRARIAEVERAEAVDVETAPLEDLLDLANRQRRAQEWAGADRLYRAVSRRFPGSDAAVVAVVASASLHLERLGDAAGALRDYRHALAAQPTGPLAEEARWGIAEAERALGDGAAEGEALRDFLAHHPGSALAPAARRRQAELAR